MRRSTLLIALISVCAIAHGQSVASYLKLRNKQHIVQPASPDALNSLIGNKIVEIQGQVTGTFQSGDSVSLMVQLNDEQTQVVDCSEAPPEWLENGTVPARLLVRVSRSAEYDPLTAQLISAAPEDPIKKVDDAYWRAEAAKSSTHSRAHSLASRHGELHGWIGRPRTRQEWGTPNDKVPQYASFILHRNPALGTEMAYKIASEVIGWSIEFGVDARLVMAVLMVESDFRPAALSSHGAQGLGQLMPGTAAWMGVKDPWDTKQNLMGMVRLLRYHLDEYVAQGKPIGEALTLALAAYNAGEGAVRRAGGVPPYRETQAYVVRVVEIYKALTADDRR